MFVAPKDFDKDGHRAEYAIRKYIARSRFTCAFYHERCPAKLGGWAVRLQMVRLRVPKDYCGQHPGPCPVRFGGSPPHRHTRFLEGADWVAFDDMVNDALDRARVAAEVWSKGQEFLSRFFIRHGESRRVEYPADYRDFHGRYFMIWDHEDLPGYFDDGHFGVRGDAPRSAYPIGTPGVPQWRLWKGSRAERALAHRHRKQKGGVA